MNNATAYIADIINDLSNALNDSASREEVVTVRMVTGNVTDALTALEAAWESGALNLDWTADEYSSAPHPMGLEVSMWGADAEARIILTPGAK